MRIATLSCMLAFAAATASAAPRAHVCSAEAMLSVDNPIANANTCLEAVEQRLEQTAATTRIAVDRRRRAATARRIVDQLVPDGIAGSQRDALISSVREIASLHAVLRAEAEEAARNRQEAIMRRVGSGMGLHEIH